MTNNGNWLVRFLGPDKICKTLSGIRTCDLSHFTTVPPNRVTERTLSVKRTHILTVDGTRWRCDGCTVDVQSQQDSQCRSHATEYVHEGAAGGERLLRVHRRRIYDSHSWCGHRIYYRLSWCRHSSRESRLILNWTASSLYVRGFRRGRRHGFLKRNDLVIGGSKWNSDPGCKCKIKIWIQDL